MLQLLDLIFQQAARHPDRLAMAGRQGSITYRALLHSVNALAAEFQANLPAGDAPIAVIGHKQPEMIGAFLAAVQSGHPYIPIDDAYPPNRIERIIQTGQPALVLTVEAVKEIVQRAPSEMKETAPRPVKPESPWYIIFTSGSTGEPKGVVITAANLSNFVEWMLGEHHFGDDELFLNQAPFSFDLSVMDLYPCLVTGGTSISLTRDEIANPKLLFETLSKSSITTWVSTPSFADMCTAEPGFSAQMLPDVRRFLFCGEILSPELAGELLRRFPATQVWNTYGPTEATVATSSIQITPEILAKYSPLPIGYPKPASRLLIRKKVETEDGSGPVAEGQQGEIVICGENVSPGYLNRPDLTGRAFFYLEGLPAYHTGDWGHAAGDLFFYDGRIDNQIKLHGYRIELGDIEANLRRLKEVQDAAVLPVYKNGVPNALAAFVLLSSSSTGSEFATTQALRQALGKLVPTYMVPRRFIYLSALPLTINGKADRRKLAEMLL